MGLVEAAAAAAGEAISGLNLSLVVAALVVYFLYTISAPRLTAPGVGPTYYPILGSTIEAVASTETLPDFFLKYSRRNNFKYTWANPTLGVGPFAKGAFVVCTPAAVKHILKDNFEKYEKTDLLREPVVEFLGNGIFTSDGAEWKFHRKIAVQMFSRSFLRQATFTAAEQACKVSQKVGKLVDAGQSFDIQSFFFAYTMDVFGLIAFGVDLQSISLDKKHPFAQAFDRVQHLCDVRMPNPFWQYGRMLRTSSEREITEGCKVIKKFAADVIASKRQSLQRGEELGLDLLSRFVEKKEMTDDEMTDVVLNFMIAGRDTTATGTSWTLYELLHHPEHITAIRNELQMVLDTKYSGVHFTELTHEEKFTVVETGLPYLRAVVLEAIRMHPPLMKDVKWCVEDDVLPDGTVIRAGQAVLYAPYVLCRNPHVWESPDDFKPERFLEKIGVAHQLSDADDDSAATASFHKPVNISEFDYPVFNAGPRICLGRALALLEMQLMLATILPDFDFDFAHPHDATYSPSLVSPLKNGLTLTARRR